MFFYIRFWFLFSHKFIISKSTKSSSTTSKSTSSRSAKSASFILIIKRLLWHKQVIINILSNFIRINRVVLKIRISVRFQSKSRVIRSYKVTWKIASKSRKSGVKISLSIVSKRVIILGEKGFISILRRWPVKNRLGLLLREMVIEILIWWFI